VTAAAEPGTDPTDEAAAATGNELLRTRHAQMFPRLTPEQIARLEHQGERVPMHAGELLFDVGDRPSKFFVVISGSVELLIAKAGGYELFYTLAPGEFSGEMNALRGSAGIHPAAHGTAVRRQLRCGAGVLGSFRRLAAPGRVPDPQRDSVQDPGRQH
jgi:hypothetical protein